MENVPNKKIRPFLILLIAALVVGLFLFGWYPRSAQWKRIHMDANHPKVSIVTVMEAKADRDPVELILPSSTLAIHETPLWARVDGYLSKFLVDIGDVVTEGQLLAEIDTPELDKQTLQAKADLQSAIAKLEIAEISAKRWETLYHKNSEAVPLQEVDERKATLKSAQADVAAAQENVLRLEKTQSFKKIYAPFDGVITQRNIDVGSLITAGSSGNLQKLFVIQQIDILRVFVYVPQNFFRLIKDGLITSVYIQEFPNQSFQGVVVRNASALDPIARTLTTEIHIDNHERKLIPGLYAEVKFTFSPDTAYFIVPTQSVIIRNAGPLMAIVDADNKVKIVPVQLGRDYGKTIEIISGLHENDQFITNPNENMKDGVQVEIRKAEQTSKPNLGQR